MEITEKNQLRKFIKNVLKENWDNLETWSQKICNKILGTDLYNNCTQILAYMALPDEVDLTPVIKKAVSDSKKVYIPKIDPGTTVMNFYEYNANAYTTGSYGISEPLEVCPLFTPDQIKNENTLILIPGRAFTKDGKRLGRGKGFYDTYLSDLIKKGDSVKNKVTFIGICFNCQLLPELPVEAHDIKMELIISEE